MYINNFCCLFIYPHLLKCLLFYRDITILKICSKINNNNDNKDSIINLYFCLLLFFLNPPNILRTT